MENRFLSHIFWRLATSKSQALRNGLLDRERMLAQIDRGEEPTGPRADWLIDASNRIVDVLAVCASEYNTKYPHDCISVYDLLDAVETTHNRFTMKAEEAAKDGGGLPDEDDSDEGGTA